MHLDASRNIRIFASVRRTLKILSYGVVWDDRQAFEARAARTLPALFLARVDGKSPVDYITTETDRDLIRHVSRKLLLSPVATLCDVRMTWTEALERTV